MKAFHSFIILTFLCGIQFLNAQEVRREIIYTLEKGHSVVTHENRFILGCGTSDFCLVTNFQGEFWVIENNKKSGPFPDLNQAFGYCKDKTPDERFTSEVTGETVFGSKNLSFTDDSKVQITFNNSLLGPYDYIHAFWTSNDKSLYYAVTQTDDQMFFISSTSGELKLNGNFTIAHMSSCGTASLVVTKTGTDVMKELMSTDMSEMSDEEMQEFLIRLDEMGQNQSEPEVFIYTSDGNSFGPFQEYTMNGPRYSISGLKNWHMVSEQKLYINGQQKHVFVDEWPNSDDIWVSADGNSFAWLTWDSLRFSDGKSYDYPLHVDYCWVNDHYQIIWICLEENSFVRYSRDF